MINPQHFPSLTAANHFDTSKDDPRYNCVAWACGDAARWWWPEPIVRDFPALKPRPYWPQGLPNEQSVAILIRLFEGRDYVLCPAAGLEEGYQKVAIYAHPDDHATHVAAQLPDGRWTSKLGEGKDINHSTLADLEGPKYGRVARIMRRPIERDPVGHSDQTTPTAMAKE